MSEPIDMRWVGIKIHEIVLEVLVEQQNGNDAIILLADKARDGIVELLKEQ
jgi:hypothetical protein